MNQEQMNDVLPFINGSDYIKRLPKSIWNYCSLSVYKMDGEKHEYCKIKYNDGRNIIETSFSIKNMTLDIFEKNLQSAAEEIIHALKESAKAKND